MDLDIMCPWSWQAVPMIRSLLWATSKMEAGNLECLGCLLFCPLLTS